MTVEAEVMMTWLGARECGQPLKAGLDIPLEPPEGMQALILALYNLF